MIPQSFVSAKKEKARNQRQSQLHLWCILLKCSYTKDFIMLSFLPGSIGSCIMKASLWNPSSAVVVEGLSSRRSLVRYFTSTSSLLSFYTNSLAKVMSVLGGPQGCIAGSSIVSLFFCLGGPGMTTESSAILESRPTTIQSRWLKNKNKMKHILGECFKYFEKMHILQEPKERETNSQVLCWSGFC